MSRVTIKKTLQSYHIEESPQTIGELHMRAQRVSFQEFIIFPRYVNPNQLLTWALVSHTISKIENQSLNGFFKNQPVNSKDEGIIYNHCLQ